ncbi:type I polyketide synthase [Sulfitobacter mediterraneus]|uniref:type I polyketide synthase n=1 Tax=Sulfitobacter mediterraneus TaxID=83219 RepID=UPI0021A6B5AB|nr:type I polyketide synthase [Sulfitobacter mediterraneus]UWR10454.1 SDR family NAD(P)-dependent oxidoreductase [Sulfitobacter mediterraneus]
MKDQNCDAAAGIHEPIAIVGMSCNLPGDNRTPAEFFDFLLKKQCGIVEIPKDRWGVDVFYDPDPAAIAKSVSKWAGFIKDVRGFDAKFFGISPREAAGMDPQQRLVLQGAVEAMMDAQIPLEEFARKSTGVFIGISQSEYRTLQEMRITSTESYAGTGYALCISANRISHRLNLTGPSYAVDTACSSSLTALDQAVQNLRTGACDMAIVGGVNAMTHPSPFLAFSKAGMISPTGRISTFDAAANGFVRGEGAGMIVIKPLSHAQADGDRIHAVIEGTAANQDGSTNTITAPNQQAQTAMLRSLFNAAPIGPEQIGFVEAHGTGTPIGDPIEAGAIGTVIGQNAPDHPVYIGSSKANVGHLESGAGITGLIKAAMAVKTGVVPPNIHFKDPSPYIPFDALNLEVPVKPEAFPDRDGPNYAVVNSFGFGGANACALLSAPPAKSYDYHPVTAQPSTAPLAGGEDGFPHLIPVSGATEEALQANAAALLEAMRGKGALAKTTLSDIAAALATKRSHLMYRAVILAHTTAQLRKALKSLASGESDAPNIITGQKQTSNKLCFTFSGQGSQWWGMARDLLERNAVFSDAVDAFDAEFIPVAGWSIRAELLKDQDSSRIDDTTVTQPALFAIQSGLAALWKEFGVEPDMVAGHSIGEAAASYITNGLSLSGAAKFLSKRGVIRDQLGAKGAMAAIGMNQADVEAILPTHGKLGIAAINGPGSTTISGDYDALHEFVEEFEMLNPDTFIRALTVDTAWHSYHLDAGEGWFRREMATIDWSVPTLPFISTVTGRPETKFDTDYGWLNLRRPVRYQAAIETAIDMGANLFLELGPAATLAGPTKSTALEAGASVTVLNSINRKNDDFETMARGAAALFAMGYPLNWQAITGTPTGHVELPQNQWVEEPFWQDSEESRGLLFTPVKHPFLGMPERGNGTTWTSEINLKAYPYLKDHRMQSDVIFPAAGYVDTMIALCRDQFGPGKIIEVENAIIHEALFINADDEVLFSNVYDPERGRVKLYSRIRDAQDDWVLRSEAKVRVLDVKAPKVRLFDPEDPSYEKIDAAYVYDVDASTGLINYGTAFQTVEDLWMSRSKTVARIILRKEGEPTKDRHHLHPTMFDGCLQILEPSMTLKKVAQGRQAGDPVCLPVGVGRMRVYADFPDEVIVRADQFKNTKGSDASVGFTVMDLDGNVLMVVEDVRVKLLPSKQAEEAGDSVPAHFVRQDIVELREPLSGDPNTGHWIVLTHGGADEPELIAAMQELGADVRCIARDVLGDDPGGALADMLGTQIENGGLSGIVVGWPLGLSEATEDTGTNALFEPIDACVKDIISLGELMDYARAGTNGLPDFVFLTSGAYPDTNGKARGAAILSQMPIAAMVRGLATEAPEYNVRVMDADADAQIAPQLLARHILTPSPDTEIILRGGTCLAPRLHHADPQDFDPKMLSVLSSDAVTNFHATMPSPGVIDQVGLVEIPLAPIGPEEVRVRVSAVGLNFRDIMAVTGLLPIEAEPEPAWQNLGLEFGGTIEAVGTEVSRFQPGDRVMGLGKRCLQRFMTIHPDALTLVPDHISLAEASTIPSAFATAHYALNHVGRMRKGEKVFIHVATGGVGTAAVQLAQAAGAEIFATAGSPAKRRHLKALGVQHVMDSRSLKFADDVMRITKGKGVDILLNSLPGDFIAKGLDIMAPYGRFLEIGKRDVYEDAAIGMKALRRNVSLSVLDLAAMGEERPDLMADLFAELAEMLTAQSLTALPLTEFPVSRVSDAIRFMSQAKHMGKVVVSMDADRFEIRRDDTRAVSLSADASYLVTGGTGGFSLSVADWLSRVGAGHLVLASRSGKIAKADEKKIKKMRDRGTEVSVVALDISDPDAVDQFVSAVQASDRPLKGVVHGAAVIKDGFANQLTPDMITDVLSPKIKGAWNLHRAFAATGTEPDFMIGFSSIAQATGSAGQTNYIAGNAFLDALAHYRLSMGRPGTAIDWGVIADAGFVSRNSALASYLESVGQFGLDRKDTDAAMELAIARDAPTFVYSRADWAQVARANPALGTSPRLASVLVATGGGTTEIRARLMQLSGDELIEEAEDYIKDEIINVLKIEKSVIQVERPMSELGLDSLSSFELKIRIETALQASIPVSKFLQAPSIRELSTMLAAEIELIRRAEAAALAQGEASGETVGDAKTSTGFAASNRQIGLLRDAAAPMTSPSALAAMEHSAICTLDGQTSVEDLEKALRKLERRHPMLTMRVGADGQIVSDGPGVTLAEGPVEALLDVANSEWARLSWQQKGDQTILALRLHHAAGDAASADLLLHEIAQVLAGEALPKPMPRRKLLEQLAKGRFDAEDPASQQDRAFWWYALTATPARPVPFGTRSRALVPALAGRNHGQAEAITNKVSGTPATSVLLRAFATALRDASRSTGPVLIGRKTSLRAGLPKGSAIGPFEIEQPLPIPTTRAGRADLAQFERVLAVADRHRKFDSHVAAAEFAAALEDWDVSPFQFLFEEVDALSSAAPQNLLHDVCLQVCKHEGQTQLRLVYDADVVTAQTAQSVSHALMANLSQVEHV